MANSNFDAALSQWLHDAWSVSAQRRDVDVDGARIACRLWGFEATDRPALLLVAGYRANTHWWDHIAPHFLDRFRVAAFDFSGAGDSDPRDAYTYEIHAAEIVGVMAALGITGCTVIGHSFGGSMAMIAGNLWPEAIGRLIVVDTFPSMQHEGGIPENPKRYYASEDEILARYRLVPPGEWVHPEVLAYIARHSITHESAGYTWKFDDKSAAFVNRDATVVREYGHPSLPMDLIFGDRTELHPQDDIISAYSRIAGCGAPIRLPLCHHHVLLERPAELCLAIRALLSREGSRPPG